jgi:hypothetical protein
MDGRTAGRTDAGPILSAGSALIRTAETAAAVCPSDIGNLQNADASLQSHVDCAAECRTARGQQVFSSPP